VSCLDSLHLLWYLQGPCKQGCPLLGILQTSKGAQKQPIDGVLKKLNYDGLQRRSASVLVHGDRRN
jgi:hypothetical protein